MMMLIFLRNLLNIKDDKHLETAESNITHIKLLDIDRLAENSDFDVEYLKQLHHYIFLIYTSGQENSELFLW